MRTLFSGLITTQEFNHLYSMSGLKSDDMYNVLYSHLVECQTPRIAIMSSGVSQSNFNRDLKKLERIYRQIQKYNEIIGVIRIT